MELKRYGVKFHDGTEIVSLFKTPSGGWSFLVRAKRQEVEMRVTPSGLLRVGTVRKAGKLTAAGFLEGASE